MSKTVSPAAIAAVVALVFPLVASAATPQFGTKEPALMCMKGAIYFLVEGTEQMPPDLDTRKPEGFLYARRLNVPVRPESEGYPGVPDRPEWFGLIYRGYFQVAMEGVYSWRLTSDDGSRLWIDGNELIDNDGVHALTDARGSVELLPGPHEIKVWYFQGPGKELALQLFVTPPDGPERIFDLGFFSRGLAEALSRLRAEATAEGIHFRLDADEVFEKGKVTLKPAGKGDLADMAKVVSSYPGCLVRIEGHTDSRGGDEKDQKLSLDQAEAVRAAVAAAAPASGARYETQGLGKASPIDTNDTAAGRAKNRRIEITIIPK